MNWVQGWEPQKCLRGTIFILLFFFWLDLGAISSDLRSSTRVLGCCYSVVGKHHGQHRTAGLGKKGNLLLPTANSTIAQLPSLHLPVPHAQTCWPRVRHGYQQLRVFTPMSHPEAGSKRLLRLFYIEQHPQLPNPMFSFSFSSTPLEMLWRPTTPPVSESNNSPCTAILYPRHVSPNNVSHLGLFSLSISQICAAWTFAPRFLAA